MSRVSYTISSLVFDEKDSSISFVRWRSETYKIETQLQWMIRPNRISCVPSNDAVTFYHLGHLSYFRYF